jgi:hypothetical protein
MILESFQPSLPPLPEESRRIYAYLPVWHGQDLAARAGEILATAQSGFQIEGTVQIGLQACQFRRQVSVPPIDLLCLLPEFVGDNTAGVAERLGDHFCLTLSLFQHLANHIHL